MRNLDTGEWLQFSVYKDPARSQPIDALNGLSLNFPLMAPTTLSIPVYGRIPARQDVAVGSYHWPVSITLSY
jgi:spore coat protein U-like protein